ncbi:MAG: DUF3021 family protein [Clostridia bacterium]|nr:DUF3021 family protein [Clostridia bacterium]
MEKFKKILYRFIYPTALIYTVLSAAFYLFSRASTTDDATRSYATLMLLMLVYAFVVALISQVFRLDKPAVVKVIIHYVLLIASLIVVFLITGAFSMSSVLIILGVFTAIYAAVAIPCVIVYNKKKATVEDKKEYKSRFSGK